MTLARLDNEIIFKKAFTNPEVLKSFVKDITGLDINPDIIETEKKYDTQEGGTDIRYDIFVEDTKQRIIVEIQKSFYDHHFDRFLNYHLKAITSQQSRADNFRIAKQVHTIIMLVSPYRITGNNPYPIQSEFLLSDLNPQDLEGKKYAFFPHKLYFLNPLYRKNTTPPEIKDWLDLVYESIKHPDNPNINTQHLGINKAAQIIDYKMLSGDELRDLKIRNESLELQEIIREEGKAEGIEQGKAEGEFQAKLVIAKNLKSLGLAVEQIMAATGLSAIDIALL